MKRIVLAVFCAFLMLPLVAQANRIPFIPHDGSFETEQNNAVNFENPERIEAMIRRSESTVIEVKVSPYVLGKGELFVLNCFPYSGGGAETIKRSAEEMNFEVEMVDPRAIYDCGVSLGFDDQGAEYKSSKRVMLTPIIDEEDLLDTVNPFTDIDFNTWEGKAITDLYYRGIVNGVSEGRFAGDLLVNRAQVTKLMILAYAGVGEMPDKVMLPDVGFADIEGDPWYLNSVEDAVHLGMVKGYPDGTFKPNNNVNTAEFLAMLTRVFDLEMGLIHEFEDVKEDDWFAAYAGVAKRYDLFPRRGSKLMPAQPLTRNEIAVALHRILTLQD